MVLAGLTVLGVVLTGATMASWFAQPVLPVNVYLLDRTAGRDYQEHRALTWTLNFLKLRHDGKVYPGGSGQPESYNFTRDYFGFVPEFGAAEQPQAEQVKEAAGTDTKVDDSKGRELIFVGKEIELPAELSAPGVLYLADTTGEFVEWDYKRGVYVRYRNKVRGIQPKDLLTIKKFHDAGGLLIGEWNSVSNSTQFTNNADAALVQRGLKETKEGLKYLQEKELPQRERDLALARKFHNISGEKQLTAQVADTKDRIERHKKQLAELTAVTGTMQVGAPGGKAQEKVAALMGVKYQGWYGRFVDHFEEEREYDYQMWKSVLTSLRSSHPDQPNIVPHGPGFVFYRDGASRVYNPDTKLLEANPFSEPIVISENELGEGGINNDFPEDVERVLLQRYINIYGALPRWNRK